MSLKKVIRKYYPQVAEPGEKSEQTAARMLEAFATDYKIFTIPELAQQTIKFGLEMQKFCYPNSTGVPDMVKECANQFVVLYLTGKNISLPNDIDAELKAVIDKILTMNSKID